MGTNQKCVPGILQIISTLNSKCRPTAILLHLYQVLLHLYQVKVLPNSNRIRSKEDLLMFYPVNNRLWIQEIPNILNSFGTRILDLHTLECFHLIVEMTMTVQMPTYHIPSILFQVYIKCDVFILNLSKHICDKIHYSFK